ncbi:MAG: amidohydrolase family protein [Cyclobacteriaceae bacterium]
MRDMKKIFILALITIFTYSLSAQTPSPGAAQSEAILVVNGTLHLGTGEVVENGAVAFENGTITFVGKSEDVEDKSKYKTIDISDQHLYPGFILPGVDLGLNEIAAVRASQDKAEVGNLKPHVRSVISYNTDSEIIPTLRFNGILTAQVAPKGGYISGTSSIMQLDAWNWEDGLIKEDDGIHMTWPAKRIFSGTEKPDQVAKVKAAYNSALQSIKDLFDAAKAYSSSTPKSKNLKLEAMKGLFDGSKQLFIRVNKAKDIIRSVTFAKEYGVKNIVLIDAIEVLLVADFVKENNIPVILNNVHSLPYRRGDDVDQMYKLPAQLEEKGLQYCLGYRGWVMGSRNLPFFAGSAAAYGLDKEEALKAITLNTAVILKIDDKLGSIEVGKDASFFVSEGDALDMRGNKLTTAYIQGRKVTLEAMQQRLYQKYKAKYGH